MFILLHAGRVLLASLFILGGVDKIMDPASSISAMQTVGLPLPDLLIWAVVALELGGGLAVAVGIGRAAQMAAVALVLHTIAINVLLHPFWALDGDMARTELPLFFKNVAVMGGLLIVASGVRLPKTAQGR